MSQVSKNVCFFSTRAGISGVIFIYTWDILFGTPCRTFYQSIKTFVEVHKSAMTHFLIMMRISSEDIRKKFIQVYYVNEIFYVQSTCMCTSAVAKIERILWFQVECIFVLQLS